MRLFLITQLIISYYVLQQATSLPVSSQWFTEIDSVLGTESEGVEERTDSELGDQTGASEEVTEDQETAAEHIYHANTGLLDMDHWFEMDIVANGRVQELRMRGTTTAEGPAKSVTQEHSQSHRPRRGGTAYERYLWPDGRVPYLFDGFVGSKSRQAAKQAMKHWMNHTCLHFVPKTRNDTDYILFVEMRGCWSYVGRQGGRQKLSLGDNQAHCQRVGVVVHELGHAIGFWHEQSRPDRDNYITILWENIRANRDDQFEKYTHGEIDSLNVTYDYASIMHYPAGAFSINGEATILPKQQGVKMGQRDGLSPLDIKQANLLYKCPVIELAKNETSLEKVLVAVEIPLEAFLIQSRHTNSCLDIDYLDSPEQNLESASLYKVVLAECNRTAREQYWMWTDNNQLLHFSTHLCLAAAASSESEFTDTLFLTLCDQRDSTQEWLCAESFIEQPTSARCIAVKHSETVDYAEELDQYLNNETTSNNLTVSIEDCSAASTDQMWNAITQLMTEFESEEQTICAKSDTHRLSRCYVKDMEPSNRTTCDRPGYYTSAFYHINWQSLDSITGMKCCATSHVFTGRPESPIAIHQEECQEVEWWSYEDATVAKGWFRCPVEGMFLKGFHLSPEAGLHGIRRAKCCKPATSRSQYEHCYTDRVQRLKNSGMHACSLSGYHITAAFKTACSQFACIEEITCCT